MNPPSVTIEDSNLSANVEVRAADVTSTNASSHVNDSLPALLAEIREVERMIALQQQKLHLLEKVRYRALAGERIDPQFLTSSLNAATSLGGDNDYGRWNSPSEGSPEWTKYLKEQFEIELDYSIVASVVMIAKVKRLPGQHGTETLLGLVDTFGNFHILDNDGEEVYVHRLNHESQVVAIAYDGTDAKKTLLATTASDGSVHVMQMEVVRNTSLASEKKIVITMSSLYKYKLHEVLPSEVESKDGTLIDANGAYVQSILIYVKQSARSFVLLLGDSVGRVTLASLMGESFDVHVISPGVPITSMTRLGTLVAIAAGHAVHIHIMGKFELPAKICRSGGIRDEDKLSLISMDMGSNPFLFARTEGGKLLGFDTKAKVINEKTGKTEVLCELVSSVDPKKDRSMNSNAFSGIPSHGSAIYGSVLALKKMILVARNCGLSIYDTSLMKATQEVNTVDFLNFNEISRKGSVCKIAAESGNGKDIGTSGMMMPRLGISIDSAFLPPKSERARAVDAIVMLTANTEIEDNIQVDAPSASGESCEVEAISADITCKFKLNRLHRSRLRLYSTVEMTGDSIENPIAGLVSHTFSELTSTSIHIIYSCTSVFRHGRLG